MIALLAGGWLPSLALAVMPVLSEVGLPLGNEPDPYAPTVAKLVKAIVQYSRWPGEPASLRACVVGPADHAEDLLAGREVRSVGVNAVAVGPDVVQPSGCEIVYLGRLSIEQQRAVTARMRGHGTLTIAENDPACRSRAMFCLLFEAEALSFRMNIDAIANSQVRIDPRVLRLGAGDR